MVSFLSIRALLLCIYDNDATPYFQAEEAGVGEFGLRIWDFGLRIWDFGFITDLTNKN
jgi:hypothetical protein